MSEGLSRVKSRQRQRKREDKHPGKSKKVNRTSERAVKKNREGAVKKASHSRTSAPTLSRKARRQAASSKASSGGNKEQGEAVPSRSDTYSSERVRLSKMFVNSLIFIFVFLLVGLLWWGIEGAPSLKTLW